MAKTNLIRGPAIAGLIGGALWIAFSVLANMRPAGVPGGAYRDVDDLAPLLLLGLGLGAAGLLGIYLRPARGWPTPSRFMLLLAAAGGLWAAFSPLFTTNWGVMMSGAWVHVGILDIALFALLLGGSLNRQSKPPVGTA